MTRRAEVVFGVAVGVVVALVALVFLLPVGEVVQNAALGLSGLVGLLGVALGTLWHRPEPLRAWWLLSIAGALFLLGLGARPWSLEQSGVLHHLADVVALSGYACLMVALATLLRAHGGLRREVIADVLVLTLAGALASLRVLVLPGIAEFRLDNGAAVMAGVYPLIDVVLLGLAVDLIITAPRHSTNRLLCGAALALLGGDLTYSWTEAGGSQLPPDSVKAFYAIAYLLFAASALNPAQRRFRAERPADPHDAWSPARLGLLGISLVALVVTAAWPARHYPDAVQVAATLTLAVAFGLLVFRAVSAVNGQARARAVLQRQASHDALTDLANRGEIDRHAAVLLATPAPAGADHWVLFCDLDGFKRVNDRWGHVAGDELLRITAQRLLAHAGGAVVGRLSGDEFVLLTTGTATQVENLAQDVLTALGRPAQLSMAEVVVTGSLGLARMSEGAAAPDDALRDADAAMYRAKGLGRNRWATFDESMRSGVGDSLDLEIALRRAVDAEAFEVVYQPVVDVLDGRPRGVEALVRWDRPGVGPVSPVVFVPVLEDAGLIVAVGRLVLTRAVTQLATWRRTGIVDDAFTVSVNVSPRQLFDREFAGDLANLLHAHRLPGRNVVLELTESSMLEGDDATLQVLHELRDLGVELAVDDFGTGYSALSYLRDFPVTRVKIDRSFINGIGRSEKDEEVVRAVVAVSKALGLGVTAEGVETAPQRDALRAMGVVHGQGWLWCKALPPAELEPKLREQVPGPYHRIPEATQVPIR